MRRFFGKLFNRIHQTNKACAASRGPRRALLRLENLEDRLVLTSATPISAALTNGLLHPMQVRANGPITNVLTRVASTGSHLPIAVAHPSQQITSTASNHNATDDMALNAVTASRGTTKTNVYDMGEFRSSIHDDPFFFDSPIR
jgi:hypothetical protein